MKLKISFIFLIIILFFDIAFSQISKDSSQQKENVININGVFPNLSILGPSDKNRSESGIGALIPWADKLWMIGYVAHIQGSGIGLYEINDNMTMVKRPESITGTFANRMVYNPSEQAIIGPHFIDKNGNVSYLCTFLLPRKSWNELIVFN